MFDDRKIHVDIDFTIDIEKIAIGVCAFVGAVAVAIIFTLLLTM